MNPGVTVDIGSSSTEANMIRARPEAYELCVNFNTLSPTGLIECKGLVDGTSLRTLDLETESSVSHNFRAFLRPYRDFAGQEGVLSEQDITSSAVNVPYTTGPLLRRHPPDGASTASASDQAAGTGLSGVDVEWVVSFHFSHDAHVAALHWGEPVFVLELERMTAKRYFSAVWSDAGGRADVVSAWAEAGKRVLEATGVSEFDVGVFNMLFQNFGGGSWEGVFMDALSLAMQNLPSKRWVQVDHHMSHASLGLWDAHREFGVFRPLVLSYDGGGNDGLTLAFKGDVLFDDEGGGDEPRRRHPQHVPHPAMALQRITLPAEMSEMNWGNAYAAVGAALPEVARKSCPVTHRERGFCNATVPLAKSAKPPPAAAAAAPGGQKEGEEEEEGDGVTVLTPPSRLALSGKMMGYAALGQADPELMAGIRAELRGCPIFATMMSHDGRVDNSAGHEACLAEFGTGHGPGGQPYLDTPKVVAGAKTKRESASRSGVGGGGGRGAVVVPLVSREEQRNVAASAQAVMEEDVVAMIREIVNADLERHASFANATLNHDHAAASLALRHRPFDGIVLVGGCGLNVRVNSAVAAAFPHLPVHVPAAPSDCGLAVGSAWLVSPPRRFRSLEEFQRAQSTLRTLQQSQHQQQSQQHPPSLPRPLKLHLLGPVLFDLEYENDFRGGGGGGEGGSGSLLPEPVLSAASEALLVDLGGVKLGTGGQGQAVSSSSSSVHATLARLLADQQVIGVVRGRCEHGPRALGHRSLLSVPTLGMKERMNALKAREWYRPVAPMVLFEDSDRVFERDSPARPLHSPYMSFAPRVTPEASVALPAVTHYDFTARPQTVRAKEDDDWVHALLAAVKVETGWGVLINTSFNTKGKPILNTLVEALTLLRDCDDLDYVLVEDFLFSKSSGPAAVGALELRSA